MLCTSICISILSHPLSFSPTLSLSPLFHPLSLTLSFSLLSRSHPLSFTPFLKHTLPLSWFLFLKLSSFLTLFSYDENVPNFWNFVFRDKLEISTLKIKWEILKIIYIGLCLFAEDASKFIRDWNIPPEAFLSIIRGQVLKLEFHVSSRQTFNGIGLLDLVP